MSTERDDLTTGEWMILRIIEAKIRDFGLNAEVPSIEEIDAAINGSGEQTALGEFVNAAWDTAESIVYDKFPELREENLEPVGPCSEHGFYCAEGSDCWANESVFRQEARRIRDYDDGIIWPDDH